MAYAELDRTRLRLLPLAERRNQVEIERDAVPPDAAPARLSDAASAVVTETAARIRWARGNRRPVMLVFGAHLIKNGLAPVVEALLAGGWVTHLATNGAGIIHDWEIAFQGATGEDVRENVGQGRFGTWQETGRYINLALAVGAYRGRGYAESVAAMVQQDALDVPGPEELEAALAGAGRARPDTGGAAADLLGLMRRFEIPGGRMPVPHPFRRYSVLSAAARRGIPLTAHPMIGHDIIYTHPWSLGAAVGRTAERDFLRFAHAVSELDGGVYLSVGSAVMSPMIFEKALSMAQNVQLQTGRRIRDHFMVVVDLAEPGRGWAAGGEPGADDPAYYLRFLKTFRRMGGEMRYAGADNRDVMLALLRALSAPRHDASRTVG